MDTKVNYVVVGLFVVCLTLAIIVASIWIAGGHHTKHYTRYLTFVDESVDGLTEKTAIKFNGVEVGYVDEMELDPTNPQQVRLVLRILQDTPINQSTVATVRSQGLTGYTYLSLRAMKQSAPPLVKPKNQPYPVIPYSASLFDQLDTIAENVSKKVTKVSDALTQLLSEENQKYVHDILQNVSDVTKTLQMNTKTLDEILKNTSKASENFDITMQDIRSTLNSAKTTFLSSDEAIKKLSDQIFPDVYTAISRLKRTMGNIEILTDQLTQNPSMLVRGKAAEAAGPGE